MNGKMVASKPLYVALAQRKEDRRARLQVCSQCLLRQYGFELGCNDGNSKSLLDDVVQIDVIILDDRY